MRFGIRTLLVLIAIAAVLLALFRIIAPMIRPSLVYAESAEFEQLPADDVALQTWLDQQPGVVRVIIVRNQKSIEVTWIMSQDILGQPPIPELKEQFERFGYRGMSRHMQR